MRFHYNERNETLEADDEAEFGDELSDKGLSIPTKAVASFDTDEQTMRLHFLDKEQMPSLFRVNFEYRMKLNTRQSPEAQSSIGLIDQIASAGRDVNFNMIAMQNSMTKQDRGSEDGYFELLGEIASQDSETLGDSRSKFERLLKEISLPGLKLREVAIKIVSLNKVFLSMHSSAARARDIKRIVVERAERLGWETVWCATDHEVVTESIVRQMRECSKFIQVLTPRRGDLETSNVEWLTAEYFGAIALGLKTLRFVDTSVRSEEQWRTHLRIASDRPLLPFSSRDDDLEDVLAPRVDRFLQDL